MSFETKVNTPDQQKENLTTQVANEGLENTKKLEGDKLDAEVGVLKEKDKAVTETNLEKARQALDDNDAEEPGKVEAMHTKEDMAAITSMFDEIGEYINEQITKKLEGKGIWNKLSTMFIDEKQMKTALRENSSLKVKVLSGKEPNLNLSLMLQQRGISACASSVVDRYKNVVDKFGPDPKTKKYSVSTHNFGEGRPAA